MQTMNQMKYPVMVPSPFRRPAAQGDQRTKKLRLVFGWIGAASAVAAGLYTQSRWGSIWLAIFVGLLTMQIVARAIPDVVTDDRKFRRAVYFLLGPAVASGFFYASYQLWETWWLASVVGLLGGWIVGGLLQVLLFPGIHREEVEDTMSRFREAQR